MLGKAIHLLRICLHTNFLLEAWIRNYGTKFSYIVIKFGMNPHRDLESGGDAMTYLEENMYVK